MCVDVYSDSLCSRGIAGCHIADVYHIYTDIWNVNCKERNWKCMGMHFDIFCVLECHVDKISEGYKG